MSSSLHQHHQQANFLLKLFRRPSLFKRNQLKKFQKTQMQSQSKRWNRKRLRLIRSLLIRKNKNRSQRIPPSRVWRKSQRLNHIKVNKARLLQWLSLKELLLKHNPKQNLNPRSLQFKFSQRKFQTRCLLPKLKVWNLWRKVKKARPLFDSSSSSNNLLKKKRYLESKELRRQKKKSNKRKYLLPLLQELKPLRVTTRQSSPSNQRSLSNLSRKNQKLTRTMTFGHGLKRSAWMS